MNFADKLDFILSIIYIVILVFVLWCVFICFGGGNMLLDSTGEVADSLPKDDNDPGAGYLLLGGLAMSGFLGLAGIVAFFVGIVYSIIAIALLVTIVRAMSRRKQYKTNQDISLIKKNIVTKLIYNTVCIVVVGLVFLGEPFVAGGIVLVVLIVLEAMLIRANSILKQYNMA